ncbi:MAG: protein kinase [Planctomycetes bacterium]|nr:protein kinase [Planctomycetota bacterium]
MKPTDDPDDTPTRFRGNPPPDAGGAEERTVPSMDAGGKAPPPPPAGKAKTPKAPDPLLGQTLGGCRIDALIGRGAMGAVYRARQISLERDVAVKVIRPEMMTDPRTLKRFEVEARTVGRFHTQHVVMVHDVGFEHGVHFLVMELVQGKNLRDHVKLLAGGRLPAAEAIPLLRQACLGLEEAQRVGVIHRDVKPDNLMLTDRGILKIADFGIAKPVESDFSMTLTSELIGTPLYMSPEQCRGAADLDFRSDMYSLGATFYYLLTGEPPVRASSVYELIQTKTKLENLCLWKALPELDQDNPLSRVIERMTALERDDRYASYEALLRDIAVVEQGGEVAAPTKGGAAAPAGAKAGKAAKPAAGSLPKLAPKAAPKPRAGVVAVIGVLAVAAAGGGFWLANRTPDATDDQRAVANGGGGAAVPDPADAGRRLGALRERLAAQGPSEALQRDVAALAVAPALAADRDRLRADVERALAIQQGLAGITAPTKLELPFAELGRHFAAVDKTTALDDGAGAELQAWVAAARTAARAERVLGVEAKAQLLAAWAQWQTDRPRASDETQLAQLGERLTGIGAAREQLLQYLPGLAADVDAVLSPDTIAKARSELELRTVSPVDVDVSAALAAIAADFEQHGPIESVVERTRKLAPTQLAQIQERDRLQNAMQRAADSRAAAERAFTDDRPRELSLPFRDVEDYHEQIERALQPLRRDDGSLAPWAEALRGKVRDEATLKDKALAVCRRAFADWERASNTDTAVPGQLEQDFELLLQGITSGAERFPSARAEFEQVVPADALASARARLATAQQRKDVLAGLPALRQRLDRVTSLGDWTSAGAAWSSELAALEQRAAAFAADAAIAGELADLGKARDRWQQAAERAQAFAQRFVAGDLAGARSIADSGVSGREGRDELRVLGSVVAGCADAFAGLDRDLDVDRAIAALDAAAGLLRDHPGLAPGVGERLARWSQRLGELRRAASGMVAVAAGSTKSGPVDAFFFGCTEVSQRDYAQFLDALHALVGALDGDARAAALRERFGDLELPADQVRTMLGRRGKLASPDLPVDSATWWEAAAFARWHGCALPTKAEWLLAAFGPDHDYAWPWGREWKREDACINIGSTLVPVTQGARSWRSNGGKTVHHIAGNAAEWLDREGNAPSGWLAGGRCQDLPADARRRAEGSDFHEASLGKALPGFGFRLILRPRQFLGADLPQGRGANAR